MLPLSDQGAEQPRGFPIVNVSIIVLNFLIFGVELIGGDPIVNGWSLIPKEIFTGQDLIGPVTVDGQTLQLYPAPFGNVYLTLLTSMFMHGGWLHILGNMLYLFIFGDNVEYNFGRAKYLVFYLLCGFGADFAQLTMSGANSVVPNLGASGAIAGVLAAYVVLFPRARVEGLVPLGFLGFLANIPAWVVIGLWILTQIVDVSLVGEQGSGVDTSVAYWAHIGGFAVGLVLTFLFRTRENVYPSRTLLGGEPPI
jgi:membrane associated rhomboid family serine protease